MIPAAFAWLDAMPLTPAGKLDRRALPPIAAQSEQTYVAPRNAVERVLAGIWGELLQRDAVGVNDNFFELGGHSLLAAQINARVREAFGVEVPLHAVFESPTVAGLAAALTSDATERDRVEKTAELLVEVAGITEDEAELLLGQSANVT
jgi:acyl carrier protein